MTMDASCHAALFFDVDGTLVSSDSKRGEETDITAFEPSPAVYDAFHRLRENGHKAFICTGRTLSMVTEPLRRLETAGIVSGAGSCVSIDGEVVSERSIEPALLERTVDELVAGGIEVVLEGTAGSVAIMRPGRTYVGIKGVPTAHSREELERIAPGPFEKFAFFSEEIDRVRARGEFFFAHYELCDLAIGFAEMSQKGVDKGAGVRRAMECLGEGPWRTYAFGDSGNDLPMMRVVDVPVAMGNALQSVKELAAYVTTSVDDDGVVHALEHFGLI